MSTHSQDNGPRRTVVTPMVAPNSGVSWRKIIPVWIVSAAVNLLVVGLTATLFALLGSVQAGALIDSNGVRTTQVEEPSVEDFDLTNDMLALNSESAQELKAERIGEDVIVPGVVDRVQASGIPAGEASTPLRNVQLPPGSGASNLADTLAKGGPEGSPGGGTDPAPLNPLETRRLLRERFEKEGGNAISEASVGLGLKWLALHQAQDGHWSLHEFNHFCREKPRPAGKITRCNCEAGTGNRNDVAATAFGLLPFLGAGITHKPGKSTSADYTKTVEGAVEWLMRRQSAADGSYSHEMYSHGLATIAMCEAYGLTSDPRIKLSAQRALNFIVHAQDPAGGGWRYAPKSAGDTSVTGWQLMALKSGQMAGLNVPKNTLKLADRFLDSVETTTKDSSKDKSGHFSYTPGSGPTITMTAVGLLCRQYSGIGPRNPALQSGVKMLKTHPPGKDNNIYYLYYATQVMHHMQGDSWRFWNEGIDETGKKIHNGMRDTLIAQQDKGTTLRKAHQIGSWGGSQGGRMMATSLSLLCLEVYYRHLPLYRRDIAPVKP